MLTAALIACAAAFVVGLVGGILSQRAVAGELYRDGYEAGRRDGEEAR